MSASALNGHGYLLPLDDNENGESDRHGNPTCATGPQRRPSAAAAGRRERDLRLWPHRHRRRVGRPGLLKGKGLHPHHHNVKSYKNSWDKCQLPYEVWWVLTFSFGMSGSSFVGQEGDGAGLRRSHTAGDHLGWVKWWWLRELHPQNFLVT